LREQQWGKVCPATNELIKLFMRTSRQVVII
jgi:hypothetical protein